MFLKVVSKPHLMSDSCVADLFLDGSSRLRRDCAFSSACALLSNMIWNFETTFKRLNSPQPDEPSRIALPCRARFLSVICYF
jgi:hypothetical protein